MSAEGSASDSNETANEPELVDLTMDDADDQMAAVLSAPVEVIEDAFLSIIDSSNDQIMEDEIIFEPPDETEQRQPQENADAGKESDTDSIIIEDESANDIDPERRQKRAFEFASWLSRLKPEHIEELHVTPYTENFIDDYVTEEPFIEMSVCRQITEAYKENDSLESIVEKFELDSVDTALLAICIATIEDKNVLNIPFGSLCFDRIDEYSLRMGADFLDQPVCGVRKPIGLLKLLQYTVTTPVQCLLLMTIIWLSENGYPCDADFTEEVSFDSPPPIDEEEIVGNVVNSMRKYWHKKPDQDVLDNNTKQLDDVLQDLKMADRELRNQLGVFKERQDVQLEVNLRTIAFSPNDVNETALRLLSPEDRSKVVQATSSTTNMQMSYRILNSKVNRNFDSQQSFVKMLIAKVGDYCLARKIACDTTDLTFAVVQGHLDRENYRVRFLASNEVYDVNIRDMAILNTGFCNPIFGGVTEVGVRVAVRRTVQTGVENREREYWSSGTIAGRHNAHLGEVLVFMDNGDDDYVKYPMKPGDIDYDIVSTELRSGEPWELENVMKRARAANMMIMVGQPINDKGLFDRTRLAHFIRDDNRKRFLSSFMVRFPEWQLMRMPIGMRFPVFNSLSDRQKSIVVVLHVDRVFAIVRYLGNPSIVGYECTEYPCTKGHPHRDEKLYRGSHRLEGAAQKKEMLAANNNLSKRRRDQFASQFEPTEMERSMPIRVTQLPVDGPRSSQKEVRQQKVQMSKDVVELRKKKQSLFNKIINETPVLTPLEDLKPHDNCGPDCLQNMDADPYDPKFHRCSPLHAPLMCGWRRHLMTLNGGKKRSPWKKVIIYYAPCGRPLEHMSEISDYLQETRSLLTIDCFSFDDQVDTETYIIVDVKYIKSDDFSGGVEGIPIPVVNSVDDDPPPKMEYSKRRFQYDESVNISSINRDFCSGCSCQGDCSDASKCECQQLSAQAMRLMPKNLQYNGREKVTPHYTNRVLYNKVITGMYECNDQCSCHRKACHNRVVQNNIKYPMQIFKTAQSGWGVRALTDIPEGAFICNYVGALLTNDLADQLKNDDQYFADLDLKDAVEIHKCREDNEEDFGFGDDNSLSFTDSEGPSSDDEKSEKEDASDKPVVMNVRARGERNVQTRQDRRRVEQEQQMDEPQEEPEEEEEEEEGTVGHGEMFSWDDYFKEASLYVVDAKLRGNLGRFLNHSCDPNVQVQHVLYDTHDLRLPWVSFFTTKLVKAGEELCWDYAYTVLNPDVERLSCNCGAPNCRRRLL